MAAVFTKRKPANSAEFLLVWLNRVLSGTAKSFRFPSREQLRSAAISSRMHEERGNIVIDKVNRSDS